MTFFCPLSTQPVWWHGAPQVGAQISFYDAGTLTPRNVYADGALGTLLQQPVLTDSNGCIPNLWLQGNPYRVRVLAPVSQNSVQIRDVDNLPGDTSVSPPPPPPTVSKPLVTGDLVWNYGTAIISGRVRCNGDTIGSATSGATELADPSAQNLFTWLWNQDANLAVVGGRGLTAAADWAANKQLTLPDMRCRTPFGIDGMGGSATGRLTGATFTFGNAGQLGAYGGESVHVMVTAELPSHTHTGTTSTQAAHTHTGTTAVSGAAAVNAVTDAQGSHQHGGSTAAAGSHTHGGATDTQGAHSHGGATGTDSPDHAHGYTAPGGAVGVGPGNAPYSVSGPPAGSTTGGATARHAHGISADGNHAHNLSINGVGDHVHGITWDGSHQHNVTVSLIAHQHTFVTDPAAAHAHSFTSDATGGGAAHNTMPPFMLVTFYLVL